MFNDKKKYFQKKLKGVQCMTWDLEFKKEKTLTIREDIRKEYDGTQARLSILNAQIKSLPEDETKWTDEQKRLKDEVIRLTADAERWVAQMKALDVEVFGSKRTNEYPDGAEGITQQIDALIELKGMIKAYIQQI